MAETFKFYTSPYQQALAIASVTSEAAGFPVELAFDNNLNTYWKPTSTATQEIAIDLGAAYVVNGLAIFIRNYDVDLQGAGGAGNMEVSYSDTGTSGPWTPVSGMRIDFVDDQTIGEPLLVGPNAADSTHRYWRIRQLFADQIIEISQFWIYRLRTIDVPSLYPEDDRYSGEAKAVPHVGLRQLVRPGSPTLIRSFTRSWVVDGADTDKETLDAVVDDVGQRSRPFIVQDGTNTPLVVNAVDVAAAPVKTNHQQWRLAMTFRERPYIRAGEVF